MTPTISQELISSRDSSESTAVILTGKTDSINEELWASFSNLNTSWRSPLSNNSVVVIFKGYPSDQSSVQLRTIELDEYSLFNRVAVTNPSRRFKAKIKVRRVLSPKPQILRFDDFWLD